MKELHSFRLDRAFLAVVVAALSLGACAPTSVDDADTVVQPVPAGESATEATSDPATERQAGVALIGGRVIDGYGGRPIEDGVILVQGDRITAVGGPGLAIPAGFERVATDGMTVMPGLIDMHVHLMILGHGDYERWDALYFDDMVEVVMPIAARQLLLSGVTTARDLGAEPGQILEVRRRIRAGEIPGPRLYVSGPFLQQQAYEEYEEPYRWGITSVTQARRVVQDLATQGVDLIKLIDQDQMDLEVVQEIVDTAHANDLPVIAHGHRMDEIRIGLAVGVDGFEHTGLGTAPGYAEDVLEGLRERNASLYWTPTVSPLLTMQYTGDVFPERLDDPTWRAGMPMPMADEIRDSLRQISHLPYYALFPSRIPRLPHKFNQLRETGIQLLIGTDSGIPTMFHTDSTWREMALWVELGVPPMEVIQAGTLWPARALGAEQDIGTLAAGRFADIIAVRGDPLTDMRVLRSVEMVYQGGRRVR